MEPLQQGVLDELITFESILGIAQAEGYKEFIKNEEQMEDDIHDPKSHMI